MSRPTAGRTSSWSSARRSLSERYRRERISVAEVLRIAVKIGSAVETAHRAGVLHRDIKPSNILLTAYGHPVLSDFGIAASLTVAKEEDSVGLSIPWSAPEVLLDETPGSIASEVWSLGATVYSLLAGRSPFEVPGGSNSSTDLMSRIARAKPQPIGRADVPASLEQLLRRAMSRKPELRPASALDFVRELQVIETELGVSQTPIEVSLDEWALGTVSDMEDRTRLRPSPGGSASTPPARRRRRAIAEKAAVYQPVGTVREGSAPNRFSASRPAPLSRRMQTITWILVASAVLVVALGATALVVLLRAAGDDGIPTVTDISATETGGAVEFRWPDPGLDDGDRYQVQIRDGEGGIQASPLFRVDADAGDTVCITVTVNRNGKTGDPSTEKCIDVLED